MVRYELKYAFPNDMLDQLPHVIGSHPAFFREIFHQRQVNNIYFDTLNLENYYANINGVGNRQKYRIRWYGNTFGDIHSPVLEIKRKFGFVGDKKSFRLPPLKLSENFSWVELSNDLRRHLNHLDNEEEFFYVKNLLDQQPVIANNYQRVYFMSGDKKFRITIDFDIQYQKITGHYFDPGHLSDNNVIVELKFDQPHAIEASRITNHFGWRITRNSKYVNGVNLLVIHAL